MGGSSETGKWVRMEVSDEDPPSPTSPLQNIETSIKKKKKNDVRPPLPFDERKEEAILRSLPVIIMVAASISYRVHVRLNKPSNFC